MSTTNKANDYLGSINWLRENYKHIWFDESLNVRERAGFLAACCDSRRCALMKLNLKDRLDAIAAALIDDFIDPEFLR